MIIPEPSATPVTTPALETVASAVLDDAHVARLVTSCDVPSDIAAVALNCDVVPRAGAAPETLIDETVADDDKGEEEHPTANAASPTTIANELNQRTIVFSRATRQVLQCCARRRGSNHCATFSVRHSHQPKYLFLLSIAAQGV